MQSSAAQTRPDQTRSPEVTLNGYEQAAGSTNTPASEAAAAPTLPQSGVCDTSVCCPEAAASGSQVHICSLSFLFSVSTLIQQLLLRGSGRMPCQNPVSPVVRAGCTSAGNMQRAKKEM